MSPKAFRAALLALIGAPDRLDGLSPAAVALRAPAHAHSR